MGVEGIPGEPGAPDQPGAWEGFEPGLGWSDSSLRHRLIFAGSSVQFSGQISGSLGANSQAEIGILEPAFRPAAPRRFVVTINSGLNIGLATLEILTTGQVLIRPQAAMTFTNLDGVSYPLE